MAKIKLQSDHATFTCPGCKNYHTVLIKGAHSWTWNGSAEWPTFEPSILMNQGHLNPGVPLCHSYVTNGSIRFLADSTHALAGQTVELPEIT